MGFIIARTLLSPFIQIPNPHDRYSKFAFEKNKQHLIEMSSIKDRGSENTSSLSCYKKKLPIPDLYTVNESGFLGFCLDQTELVRQKTNGIYRAAWNTQYGKGYTILSNGHKKIRPFTAEMNCALSGVIQRVIVDFRCTDE